MKHVQYLRPVGGGVRPKRWRRPIPGHRDLPRTHHIPVERLRRLADESGGRWRSSRQRWLDFLIWQDWHGLRLHQQNKIYGGK